MPRAPKASAPTAASTTLILDNGAYTIKAGLSTADTPHLIPNTLAKLPSSKHTYVGAQLSSCKDFAEMVFRRPVQRGQLTNWESEREIWSQSFFDGKDSVVAVEPTETNLLLTEAPNTLGILREHVDQVVMEEFEFKGYRRLVGPALNAYGEVRGLFGDGDGKGEKGLEGVDGGSADRMEVDGSGQMQDTLAAECVLVVDSGYSHTTVTPVYKGRPIQQAIRRLEVGGKLLTNYLKELVSSRSPVDLTAEFHIVNEMKENVSFVSRDFKRDLERTWKQSPKYDFKSKPPGKSHDDFDISMTESGGQTKEPADESIVLDYVLPDYTTLFRGRAQPHDPALTKPSAKLQQRLAGGGASHEMVTLGNERFSGPELFFSPSDIGLSQAGLPEVIMQSVRAIPTGLWTAMLCNILVVGGNAMIPGFAERLFDDLRALAPVECVVRVNRAEDPITNAWQGGARLVEKAKAAGRLGEVFITRQEYQEHGGERAWLMRQFGGENHLPA